MHYITMIVLFCWFCCCYVGLCGVFFLRLFHLFLNIGYGCYRDGVILYFCRKNVALRGVSGVLCGKQGEWLIEMQ